MALCVRSHLRVMHSLQFYSEGQITSSSIFIFFTTIPHWPYQHRHIEPCARRVPPFRAHASADGCNDAMLDPTLTAGDPLV